MDTTFSRLCACTVVTSSLYSTSNIFLLLPLLKAFSWQQIHSPTHTHTYPHTYRNHTHFVHDAGYPKKIWPHFAYAHELCVYKHLHRYQRPVTIHRDSVEIQEISIQYLVVAKCVTGDDAKIVSPVLTLPPAQRSLNLIPTHRIWASPTHILTTSQRMMA